MMVHGDEEDSSGRASRRVYSGSEPTPLVSDIAGLEAAISKLQYMLKTVGTYVDSVVVRDLVMALV